MERADFLRMKRIGNIVLQELAGSPARDVKEAVVEREVDVGDERGHGLEPLEQGRQLFRIGRLGWYFDHFVHTPFAILPMPNPDRSGLVFQGDDDTEKSVGAAGVVRRTQL